MNSRVVILLERLVILPLLLVCFELLRRDLGMVLPISCFFVSRNTPFI